MGLGLEMRVHFHRKCVVALVNVCACVSAAKGL
jgi:hypothetical protein